MAHPAVKDRSRIITLFFDVKNGILSRERWFVGIPSGPELVEHLLLREPGYITPGRENEKRQVIRLQWFHFLDPIVAACCRQHINKIDDF
ncbi:hypothetical protein [Pararhizobium arenae]|uniref:hypothetical protein n=1 Tax=Pararhizobium arenae TaxID=1856850 RepID=UPI001AED0A67|nr:hypothetical protein [Pararhizobium arenae]